MNKHHKSPDADLFELSVDQLDDVAGGMGYAIIDSCCIGCSACRSYCPMNCIVQQGAGYYIDQTKCNGCGSCVSICPVNAVKPLGWF